MQNRYYLPKYYLHGYHAVTDIKMSVSPACKLDHKRKKKKELIRIQKVQGKINRTSNEPDNSIL